MGCNYYWIGHRYDESIQYHIGKRSAAGRYCWDCGITLCKNGTRGVHNSERNDMLDACPMCGKLADGSGAITGTSAGVELGFSKATEVLRGGVSSCSSFTWTAMAHKEDLKTFAAGAKPDRKVVVNEYGDEFTAAEFLDGELACVAIEFQDARGFS